MQFTKNTLISLIKISLIALLVVVGGVAVWASSLTIPDLESFEERIVEQSTKIYDRTGETVLFDFHEDIRRTVVSSDDISEHIKEAAIAIEDDKFYEHAGIQPLAILRAAIANARSGEFSQGGSTITQQVVKNALLTQDKKITRKLKEMILALKLETILTKEEILTYYLNEAPYGGTIYGVEEASQSFFGKPASEVEIVEAAYLAALPQAPTYYSPYGEHTAALEARKNKVLGQMRNNGFISQSEYETALAQEIEFIPEENRNIKAPHFVFYVLDELIREYGERALREKGLRVVTTLDYDLQQEAQKIVEENALSNETRFNAENGGMVATKPDTGEVLVMVGSRDYFDEEIDGKFNVATALRQPGSSFKPYVYASALNEGYTPETSVFDLRTQFSTACNPANFTSEGACYSPVNYDGKFRGPVTFREALAQSINVPAVKVLYLTGLNDSLELARKMGITSLTSPERYGLTLVLGGGEVSLLEMTGAYGVFANEGRRVEPSVILSVKDNEGEILFEREDFDSDRVLPKQTALQISSMLADNEARSPAFGQNSPLYFPGREVAAKTGTTNDYRDAWIVGYTPEIAVGAWAGNNDNSPMTKEVAGFTVAPMWNQFMKFVFAEQGDHDNFEVPEPEEVEKPILAGVWSDGSVHNILHWVNKDNPKGGYPSNPRRDSQYILWEYPVQRWASSQGYETGDIKPVGNAPMIMGLRDKYNSGDNINFSIETPSQTKKIEVYINNSLIIERNSPPFSFSLDTDYDVLGTDNNIEVKIFIPNDEITLTDNFKIN